MTFVTDEHIRHAVYRGLLAREPVLDVVRVQDVGLRTAPDPEVLEWAAANGRVLVTEDRNTMTALIYDRVRAGLPMPGVIMVRRNCTVGRLIEELLTVMLCATENDFTDQIVYVPL